jgi:hypothetical protein
VATASSARPRNVAEYTMRVPALRGVERVPQAYQALYLSTR